jgi:alpha-L-fucosidase 2
MKANSYYQIDGNLGAAAGLAEMLLQSHNGVVRLLPALPEAWATGSFRGLRARGSVEVDCTWRQGKATKATLRPYRDTEVHLAAPKGQKITGVVADRGAPPHSNRAADGTVAAILKQGSTYSIRFS